MKYRLYLETDLNRVFTTSLPSVAASELDVVLTHQLEAPGTEVDIVDDGRTSYLAFDHHGDPERLAEQLAMLSATCAVFAEHDPRALEPIAIRQRLAFGTDVVTAQRYKGKTSERLTRLMLNVALAARATAPESWTVLDPMCGRGTTLNWALLYGGRGFGIDVDRKALDDYALFLEQWAKKNRLPHRIQRYKKRNSESRHFDFTVGTDRTELSGKTGPDISTFHAPADRTSVPVGRHSMIVSDLPYGIQHRARTDGDRTPTSVGELVEAVAACWRSWVQPGATVALAWNVKSLAKHDMVPILDTVGFDEVSNAGFEHEVDRMITRDVALFAERRR